MFEYPIDANGEFKIDGARLRIDLRPGSQRSLSDEHAFTLVKHKQFLDIYADIAKRFRPSSLLELGIFQGGGYVFLDKMFKPDHMSAVDISPKPIAPLMSYISRTPNRAAHFSTSQDDETALGRIVKDDLGGRLDMVVDDASHLYGLTKRSFEILFPLLPPGGLYIIEDWAWAHQPPYQAPDATWHDQPAMSALLMEITTLIGSDTAVQSIEIHRPFAVVTRGHGDASQLFSKIRLRGKAFPSF